MTLPIPRKRPPFPTPGRPGWLLVAVLAAGTALFSAPPYVLFDAARNRIPLDAETASHFLWITVHAVPGCLALLLGPVQFLPWTRRRPAAHRWAGRAYLLSVLAGGVAGAVAAVLSVSGLAAQVGFLLLAAAWLHSGLQGFLTARRRRFDLHRVWMVRNYALTFAAVLLRVFLGIGVLAMERGAPVTFDEVYTASAWASIFVSVVAAEWFVLAAPARPDARRPAAPAVA